MNKDKLAAEVTQELDQSPAPSSGDDRHPARGMVALAPTNDTAMKEELAQTLGRPVDLVEKSALRNALRRRVILSHSEVIYAA